MDKMEENKNGSEVQEEGTGMKGIIEEVNIDQEMRSAYIDYSMSVIVSRALPDARDGLKPVQRRVLFGMEGLGLDYSGQTKKSARIVGEVLGKFHPHGDSSVYDAMARLAQWWNQRYPLVYGQGNFGSMDGDPVAAMRYTEAKLEKLANDVLADMDKDTVDFQLNFDDTIPEPTVLPTKAPLLLLNGSAGEHFLLVHHVRNLGHYDGLTAIVVDFDFRLGTDHDSASSCFISVLDALNALDKTSGREIRSLDILHETVRVNVRVVDICADRIAALAEVMRCHVCGHTYGNT